MDSAIRQTLRELQTTDNISGFGKILGNYLVIACAIALTHVSYWFYPITLILIGSRLRALDNLSHEAFHNQVFRNAGLNDWVVSLFCAFPVHVSIGVLRKVHRNHHTNVGDLERDPNLCKYAHLPLPKTDQIWYLLRVFSGTYHLRRHLVGYAQCFLNPYSWQELGARLLCWLSVFTLVGMTQNGWAFLLFYVIPFFTSYAAIRQLVNMSEHMLDPNVPYFTRNIMCHPIVQFIMFPHADHLHLVHHINPAIPGARLRQAHQILLADSDYANLATFDGYFCGQNSFFAWAFQDIEIRKPVSVMQG